MTSQQEAESVLSKVKDLLPKDFSLAGIYNEKEMYFIECFCRRNILFKSELDPVFNICKQNGAADIMICFSKIDGVFLKIY